MIQNINLTRCRLWTSQNYSQKCFLRNFNDWYFMVDCDIFVLYCMCCNWRRILYQRTNNTNTMTTTIMMRWMSITLRCMRPRIKFIYSYNRSILYIIFTTFLYLSFMLDYFYDSLETLQNLKTNNQGFCPNHNCDFCNRNRRWSLFIASDALRGSLYQTFYQILK